MIRRLFLLNGLAIIAVVANHATFWGFEALFNWSYRYLPAGDVSHSEQLDTLIYYGLLITIQKLAEFSVPSFLFVSGFFFTYASRGNGQALDWKIIKTRLTNLLIPYIIWSILIFLTEWLKSCLQTCQSDSLSMYVAKLAFGQAAAPYYYIPLICQYYLLAPFLVRFAKTQWKLMLLISAGIQLIAKILLYLHFFNINLLGANIITLPQLFPNTIFYTSLGVVAGFHLQGLRQWLACIKWSLLVITVICGISSCVEGWFLYRFNLGGERTTLLTSFYAVAFILCYLAFENSTIPFAKIISEFGSKSYGLYLIHPKVGDFVARGIYYLAPMLLAMPILFQVILIISGIGIPFLIMTLVARSKMQVTYRYLFG